MLYCAGRGEAANISRDIMKLRTVELSFNGLDFVGAFEASLHESFELSLNHLLAKR